MSNVRLKKLYGGRFRSFKQPFSIDLPDTGMVLISGLNQDTGDPSGAGKSSLVLAISYLFGGCPFPGTELQNSEDDEPFLVGAVLENEHGQWTVERQKGLRITPPGGPTMKGKIAEVELDALFGMDEKTRAITTYRGQNEDGLFISMPDAAKKEFLSSVLGLEVFSSIAEEASAKAKFLLQEQSKQTGVLEEATRSLSLDEQEVRPIDELQAESASLAGLIEQLDLAKTENQSQLEEQDRRWEEIYQKIQETQAAIVAKTAKVKAKAQEKRDALNVAWREAFVTVESDSINALLNERTMVQKDLAEAAKEDTQASQAHERKRADIRTKIALLGVKVRKIPEVEASINTLDADIKALEANVCSTCSQPWLTDSLPGILAGKKLELEDNKKALQALLVEKDLCSELSGQLKSMSDWPPSEKALSLQGRLDGLTKCLEVESKAVAGVTAAKAKKVKEDIAALDEKETQVIGSQTAPLNEQLALLTAEKTALSKTLADGGRLKCSLIDKASVLQAQKAGIDHRIEAHKVQQKLLLKKRERVSALQLAADQLAEELHLEQDVAALVGKNGFLNVIFDDVLAEVAASTNEILAGIANVRHIVVSFDTEDPTRIVPMVSVSGESRPLRSYLSGGQQSAVKLALDLGLGAVVAKRRGRYPGFLVLDESFDGLGPVAQESCLEVLSAASKDRLIFVIQHADRFAGMFDEVIHVKFVDGESFIGS